MILDLCTVGNIFSEGVVEKSTTRYNYNWYFGIEPGR